MTTCPENIVRRIASDLASEAAQSARRAVARIGVTQREAFVRAIDLVEVALIVKYDDLGYYANWDWQREVSHGDRRFAFSADGAYTALLRERTGEVQTDEQAEKMARQNAALLDLSKALADKMGTAADPDAVRDLVEEMTTAARGGGSDGVREGKAYLATARELAPRFSAYRETGFELRRYFLHSRQVELLPNYRRIRFIPYVAQSLRAPLVAALEFWLSKTPMARFWTFTSGIRVALSGVRDRAQEMHARLRKLNKRKFMREAGVQIVFRSTEMGTPEYDESGNAVDGGRIEYDQDGQAYFHVHAHCVVELTRGYIPAEKWAVLLRKVHGFWRHRWRDDGAILSAREVCKYVTKPAEMLKLSADDLVALEEQLSGCRLTETAGSLRAEIDARAVAGERLVKRKTPDGRVYYAVRDWNKHQTRTKPEEAQDAAQKLEAKTARGCVRIVSRGTPRFGSARVAEPCVTVMCMRGSWDENAVRSHVLVAPIISATAAKYREGVARRDSAVLGINVHTRTSTVPAIPAAPRGKPKRAPVGASARGF